MMDPLKTIDRHYPQGSEARDIYLRHCRDVAALARDIAQSRHLPLDPRDIEAAAMLHDIGICLTDAPGIGCHGKAHYLAHGVMGADLLRREGWPEWVARVAERHTGAGITRQEILDCHLPIPAADYLPMTLLERLICYADKFYSKSGTMQRKTLDHVRRSLDKFGPAARQRFEKLHAEFSNEE